MAANEITNLSQSGKNSQPAYNVLVDDREKNQDLLDCLTQTEGLDITVTRLGTGDFQLGNLLFERKTLTDFAASVLDGRLFRQAAALASQPLSPVLILEGTSADLLKSKFKREALQGALITVSLIYKIPVLRSYSPSETANLMLIAARQLSKMNGTARSTIRNYRRKGFSKKQKIELAILQIFPGVGISRAKLLLEKKGTLAEIFTSRPSVLKEIAGIGRSTVKNIWNVLHGKAGRPAEL